MGDAPSNQRPPPCKGESGCCRGFAEPAQLSRFLSSSLPSVTRYCARGGVRVASTNVSLAGLKSPVLALPLRRTRRTGRPCAAHLSIVTLSRTSPASYLPPTYSGEGVLKIRWPLGISGCSNVLSTMTREKKPTTRTVSVPPLRKACGTMAGTSAISPADI